MLQALQDSAAPMCDVIFSSSCPFRLLAVDSDEESYSDDEDDSSQPGGSSIILPPPLPPSAAAPRKVLSWGVSGASGHRSQERRQPAAHTPQALAQRSTQSNAGSGINTDKEIGSCVRRGGSEESSESGPGSGSPARARALASDCDTAPRSASTDAEHSNNVAKAGIIQHHGLVGAECDVVSQSASADKHSNNVAMARSTKHDGCVGAKGGDNGKLYASGAANGGGATAGWVDEEGVRRSVLREVLAVMLGPQAAHKVDCYQLDVKTVAAVAQQRPSNSPSSSNHTGAVAAQRLAKEQAEKAAALEARSRAERELAACKSMLDEERTQAKRKLDASKREAEGLVKEKRDLMARLGQQGRDARAAASALQVCVAQGCGASASALCAAHVCGAFAVWGEC
ncbi:hypothetical protein DUNSADRAFT_3206 [Dunaliella salina]|uniref:Uncharacterized protein n=1 Tax=Dunaliella salina TaxID=3046 RepID=A0ABQ7GUD1_DUNSA|nr:hypothetical protein DUNSADRAFT_3206 [Dunaliella salina]|eukprot:KAF5838227.1 hypothetical protein DUNSADRAFT_3206 [Dunaliella salina]